MRWFFVAVILSGLGLGFGYEWYVENLSGEPIGSLPGFRSEIGFMPASVVLSADQSPVRVFVDLISMGLNTPDGAHMALKLTVSCGNKTSLASSVFFSVPAARSENPDAWEIGDAPQNPLADKGPQSPIPVFRERAEDLMISEPGEYRFVLGQIGHSTLVPRRIDIVLRSHAELADPRVQPTGFAVLALGVVGLLLHSLHWRRKSAAVMPQQEETEKPKWGRDAADS